MPHVTAQTLRMAPSGCPTNLLSGKNISSNVTRVTVKTSGKQQDFMVADDTLVRQFKEKLSAHFNCEMDQLVLVFMGRLLRDHDTLSQRGILDGHTIYLVIKSKHGSQSVAHSSRNLPCNEPGKRDGTIKGNSIGLHQPASMSQIPVEEPPFIVKPEMSKVNIQNLEVGCPGHMAQMLDNPSIRQLLSNMNLMRQFISELPGMQRLMQENPEVSQILDNSEILWQTLELVRNLAVIREIMQIQQPAQNLEHSQNPQLHLGLETIPSEDNVVSQSYAGFSDQITNNLYDTFGNNLSKVLRPERVPEHIESPPSSPPSQKQRDPLPQLPTTRVIYTSSCGLSSANTSPSRMNRTAKANAATASTKDRSHKCAIQQPVEVPALPSMKIAQQEQTESKDDISLSDSDERLEDDLQLLDEQTNSQITRNVMQLLMSDPWLAAHMMLFMNMPQLSEQWRQQMSTFLQQTQLSDLLVSLANPKALQAILQIEQGLQLLATETPVLLPWVAPYLWGLGWLPGPSCSYPDMAPWSWDVPDMTDPKGPEFCHKSEAVLQRLCSEDPSYSLQAPEIRFRRQMESLQAMGFGNHHANLQALIATEGDTSAALQKLKRSQGF